MIIKLFYGQNAQRKRDMKIQCWPWHGFISMEQEQHRIYAGRRNGMKKFLQSIPGMFRRYSVLVKYIFLSMSMMMPVNIFIRHTR